MNTFLNFSTLNIFSTYHVYGEEWVVSFFIFSVCVALHGRRWDCYCDLPDWLVYQLHHLRQCLRQRQPHGVDVFPTRKVRLSSVHTSHPAVVFGILGLFVVSFLAVDAIVSPIEPGPLGHFTVGCR